MTTQHKLLATARKPLDTRALLDNWAMLLAALGIFLLCALPVSYTHLTLPTILLV